MNERSLKAILSDSAAYLESAEASEYGAEGHAGKNQAPKSTISDLARDFGVTFRALRFYESRGLLSPTRDGVQRIYSPADRARLALILKGKQLGFTLNEIYAMVAEEKLADTRADRNAATLAGLHLTHRQIAEQLELLRNQQRDVAVAIAELEVAFQRVRAG
ncbi:MerR family transcriptional regulator [Bosea caraganae]|uniref:MerR family transcriptional regulator n=1 Tax=Bosea caraganae TaxID=2763117 RepID=A0A370KXN8_9HYPH|nr:MerR family transcriptional regulator [Bosea caraganae]RDJ19765.1 MerR family transcriptional regulator [Bosea caraganae]RDJ21132.1 MerR family transcriptional regulator [Bosea caraganae]